MSKEKEKPQPRGKPVDKKIRESTLHERLKDGFWLLEGKEIES